MTPEDKVDQVNRLLQGKGSQRRVEELSVEELTRLIESGIITRNEVRGILGLEPMETGA